MANASKQIIIQSLVLNRHPLMYTQLPTSERTLSNANKDFRHYSFVFAVPSTCVHLPFFRCSFDICVRGWRWPLLLKNGHVPQKFYSAIFSKNVPFFEKIVKWRNIQYLISHKQRYINFRRQTPPSPQKRLGPQKRFFPFSQKITDFLKKTVK